jgi:hypothetical protein
MRHMSPNELHKYSCDTMLRGRSPTTDKEWMLVVNCWAANIAKGMTSDAVRIMALLYNCPLDAEILELISAFQDDRKGPKAQEETDNDLQSNSVPKAD